MTGNRFLEVTTADEAHHAVMQAIAENRKIVPAGSCKNLPDCRQWPDSKIDIISTAPMKEVFEFNPDDLAIRIGAGATPLDIIKILDGSNLIWPVSGAHLAQRSLGAILNEGISGDETSQYGLMVDSLIGTEMISPEGKRIKSGGAMVKNVSGYDLTRLCWRALGSLGLIVNLTLKLVPAPEAKYLFEVKLSDPALGADLAEKIILSRIGTQCLKIVYNGVWYLLVGVAGFSEIVEMKRKQIDRLVKDSGIYYEGIDNPEFFSRPEIVKCSGQTVSSRGRRRNLLNLAADKDLLKRISGYIEIDINGSCARYYPHESKNIGGGLTQDTLSTTGTIYQRVKKAIDPRNIFPPHQ